MLGAPRIIAFDDNPPDLKALLQGIHAAGGTCRGYNFSADPDLMTVTEAPYVRIMFFDLNMISSSAASDFSQHFSTIVNLLERVNPIGPYLLVVWTRYPEQVDGLNSYLNDRALLCAKPFMVARLEKEMFIDENRRIRDLPTFAAKIKSFINESPALAALVDWEEKVFAAAAKTLSNIIMFGRLDKSAETQQQDVSRVLTKMAQDAVGSENVATHPSRAVCDALLPVLADHVSSSNSDVRDDPLWQEAIRNPDEQPSISEEEAAALNGAIHIANDIGEDRGAERGSVMAMRCALVDRDFESIFGIEESEAAAKQFLCKDFDNNNETFRWVLVQVQAACDYAQGQPGPLPFYLGLDMPVTARNKSRKMPAALWVSPPFKTNADIRLLSVNIRFHLSLTTAQARNIEPHFRLREQILGELINHAQGNATRPGIISFGS